MMKSPRVAAIAAATLLMTGAALAQTAGGTGTSTGTAAGAGMSRTDAGGAATKGADGTMMQEAGTDTDASVGQTASKMSNGAGGPDGLNSKSKGK